MRDAIDHLRPYIHHHHSDERFCGSTLPMRQFSFADGEVNCPRCRPQTAAAELVCEKAEGS